MAINALKQVERKNAKVIRAGNSNQEINPLIQVNRAEWDRQ